MTPPEQAPLRALSDTVEQWSRETDEFFSVLQQQLRAAHAGLAALQAIPGQAAQMHSETNQVHLETNQVHSETNEVRSAADDALAERLAMLQSQNELLREQLAGESGARSTLEEQVRSLQASQQDVALLQTRVRELQDELRSTQEKLATLSKPHAPAAVVPPGKAAPQKPALATPQKKTVMAFEVPAIMAFDGQGHKKKTGEILVDEGILTHQQLQQVLSAQAGSPQVRLGALAIERGYTSEALVAKVLAAQLRLPYVDLPAISIEPAVIASLSNHLARLHQCIPLHRDDQRLVVAMSNPLDLIAIEDIELASRLRVDPVVASSAAIQTAVERFYPAAS